MNDVNCDNMVIEINRKGNEITLPIDNDFMEYVYAAIEETWRYKDVRNYRSCDPEAVKEYYFESDYLIKNIKQEPLTYRSIYTRTSIVIKQNNKIPIDLNLLNKCRRFDFAINLAKEKKEKGEQITQNDLRSICELLGIPEGHNTVSIFKKEMKDYFDIDVKVRKTGKKSHNIFRIINKETGEIVEKEMFGEVCDYISSETGAVYTLAVREAIKGKRKSYKGYKIEKETITE